MRVERVGVASLALALSAFRGADAVLAARLVIVTTSLEHRSAIPLPDDLRTAAKRYLDAQPLEDASGDRP